jgi:hypothetical protein
MHAETGDGHHHAQDHDNGNAQQEKIVLRHRAPRLRSGCTPAWSTR